MLVERPLERHQSRLESPRVFVDVARLVAVRLVRGGVVVPLRDVSRFTLNRRPLQFNKRVAAGRRPPSVRRGDNQVSIVCVARAQGSCIRFRSNEKATCRNVNPIRSAAVEVVKNQQMWNAVRDQ